MLRRYLSRLLRDNGFQKVEPRKGWKWHEHAICVFEVHAVGAYFSAVTGWPPMSITAWTGMYYDFIPNDLPRPIAVDAKDRPLPREWECHLRGHVERTLDQSKYQSVLANPPERKRKDIWWIEPNGANLVEVVENLALCVAEQAFPWFERFSNLSVAFTEIEVENACYHKHRRAMYFARQLGEIEKAKRYEALFEEDRVNMESLSNQLQSSRRRKK